MECFSSKELKNMFGLITDVTAFYKTYMPSTEVTRLGGLPSGQHSNAGSC